MNEDEYQFYGQTRTHVISVNGFNEYAAQVEMCPREDDFDVLSVRWNTGEIEAVIVVLTDALNEMRQREQRRKETAT